MKKYLIEFTMLDGSKQEVELTTDNLERSLEQWCRNRQVVKHEIINEGTSDRKQMLLG